MLALKEKHTNSILLAGCILLIMLALLSLTPWLNSLEDLSLDVRFILRGQRPFPNEIVVIGIDEPSLDALGRWPWPREKHGALLHLLSQSPFRPGVLAYDILFEHPDIKFPESDLKFANQALNFGDDVLFAYFFEKGVISSVETSSDKEKKLDRFAFPPSNEIPEKLEQMDKVSLPYPALIEKSTLGFANNLVDSDGRTRRLLLLAKRDGRVYPSFALLAAMKFMGAGLNDLEIHKRSIVIKKSRLGTRVIPITASGEMLINYWGSFGKIPSISCLRLFQEGSAWMSQNRNPVHFKSLKGKLVLVGATALGLEDRSVTPYHRNDPGSSIQAQAIANILAGKFLHRAPRAVSLAILFFVGLLVVFLASTQTALRAFGSIFIVIICYLAIAHIAFLNDYWIDIAWPLISMFVLLVAILGFRYFLTAEELKKTYAQLIHAEKMASLGTLSASIAHEYRNFMASISMAAESCMVPGIKQESLNKCLEIIGRTVKKATMVSESLLTFARKNESLKKEGRLEKVIEDVLIIMEKSLKMESIEVKKEVADIGPVQFDEGQISQVLMNMIRNGRDALKGRKDKQITLRLKDMGDKVLIEISDNGSGIPKKVLKQLFVPFTTSKKAGEGTGLGLSVCHGIILNHGGDIKVQTEEEKGTTWLITLPKH